MPTGPKPCSGERSSSTRNQNSFWNSFTRVRGGVEYALLLFFFLFDPLGVASLVANLGHTLGQTCLSVPIGCLGCYLPPVVQPLPPYRAGAMAGATKLFLAAYNLLMAATFAYLLGVLALEYSRSPAFILAHCWQHLGGLVKVGLSLS